MVVNNRVQSAHKQNKSLVLGRNSSNEIASANANDVEAPLQIASSVKSFAMGSSNIGIVYDNNTVFLYRWFSSVSKTNVLPNLHHNCNQADLF